MKLKYLVRADWLLVADTQKMFMILDFFSHKDFRSIKIFDDKNYNI